MSKGKTKSTSTGTQTSTQTLNPWSQNLFQNQWNTVQDTMNNTPVQAYTGRSMADFGASADQYMNPYTQEVIDTTMADITRMNDQNNAQTRGRAAASGAYGGNRVAVAENLNNAEAMRQMATTGANLRYQGYNDAYGRYGADINQEYMDFIRQREEEQRRLGVQVGLLGTIPMLTNSSGTSSGTQTQTTNPGLLGTLGQAAQIGSTLMAFSDARLKEDIEPAGQKNGHNWYRYRYVWDEPGTVREGVLAQEVLATRPDAVGERDGFLTVNYETLGV